MDHDDANGDPRDEDADPMIGSTLQGRYRILERLAAGGMGVVYRGLHTQLEKIVAVKFLHAGFMSSPESMQRFKREALTMSRLAHPNCVSVIDYGVEAAPFIVMDFVVGKTLEKELELHGRLPPGRAIHIMKQILSALMHAHGQGLVHRDIKPENVMLSEAEGTTDHVLVLDFGLAKFSDMQGNNITGAAKLLGTPSYMSPEQTRGETLGPGTDLYSAGVVLFELITGHKPFEAENPLEVLYMHQGATIPRLRDRLGGVTFSEDLENVLRSALAKKPDERFASAAAFANALEAVPEAATYTPTRLATAKGGSRPAGKRGRAGGQPMSLAATQPVGTLDPEKMGAALNDTAPQEAISTDQVPERSVSSGGEATAELRAPRGGAGMSRPAADKSLETQPLQVISVDTSLPGVGAEASSSAISLAEPSGLETSVETPVEVSAEMARPTHGVGTLDIPRDRVEGAPVERGSGAAPSPAGGRKLALIGGLALAALVAGGLWWMMSGGDGDGDGDAGEEAAATAVVADDGAPETGAAATQVAGTGSGEDAGSAPADAAAAPEPIVVKRVGDFERLIKLGRKEEAIEGGKLLLAGGVKNPAYIQYMLGNLYFDVGQTNRGLAEYRKALTKVYKYRTYSSINENIISAFGNDKAYPAARAIYTQVIKRAGLRYLKQAATDHPNQEVRQRAARVASQVGGRR